MKKCVHWREKKKRVYTYSKGSSSKLNICIFSCKCWSTIPKSYRSSLEKKKGKKNPNHSKLLFQNSSEKLVGNGAKSGMNIITSNKREHTTKNAITKKPLYPLTKEHIEKIFSVVQNYCNFIWHRFN